MAPPSKWVAVGSVLIYNNELNYVVENYDHERPKRFSYLLRHLPTGKTLTYGMIEKDKMEVLSLVRKHCLVIHFDRSSFIVTLLAGQEKCLFQLTNQNPLHCEILEKFCKFWDVYVELVSYSGEGYISSFRIEESTNPRIMKILREKKLVREMVDVGSIVELYGEMMYVLQNYAGKRLESFSYMLRNISTGQILNSGIIDRVNMKVLSELPQRYSVVYYRRKSLTLCLRRDQRSQAGVRNLGSLEQTFQLKKGNPLHIRILKVLYTKHWDVTVDIICLFGIDYLCGYKCSRKGD